MKSNIAILIVFILFTFNLKAEGTKTDKERLVKKEKKEEQLRERWNRIIPKQHKLQFAGSMGLLSASVGWHYGKRSQWETDLFIGFIPKMSSQNSHITFTLKETYTPWRISLNENFCYEPLTTGIYINKIFGEYFWNKLPEKYPENYYFWASNTRFNVFLGQAFTFNLSKTAMNGKELSFFYELSTNDLYVISAIGNKTISTFDIIGFSVGVRYRLF